jgi:transcriptional regulator with XRE-family HTH domain
VEPRPDPRQETAGKRIRRLRIELGLSQRDLASTGISHAHLSRIETGRRRATVDVLRKLAPALGVTVEYLETGASIAGAAARELRLADAELQLRLGGDAADAEQAFAQLLKEATHAGDLDAQLRARIGLGLVAARNGAFLDVVRRLERVLDDPRVAPLTHPDVFATLAHAYVETGDGARAIALLERCLDHLRAARPANAAGVIRFALYLSSALADTGDLERAQEVTSEAFDLEAAADRYSLVRLYWSQARLAAAQGNSILASSSIRRAIALLETTEDERQLARARLLAATIALTSGRLTDADEQLDRVETRYLAALDVQELAILRAEQAKLAARRGDGTRAVALARQALDLAAGDPPERGRAEWALAEGLAAQDDVDAAAAAFERAHELLRAETGFLPELLDAWARTLRAAGRAAVAARLERQAHSIRRRKTEAP